MLTRVMLIKSGASSIFSSWALNWATLGHDHRGLESLFYTLEEQLWRILHWSIVESAVIITISVYYEVDTEDKRDMHDLCSRMDNILAKIYGKGKVWFDSMKL